MLAYARIVFTKAQLFRQGARVLLLGVVVTRTSGADKLDEDGGCLGHVRTLYLKSVLSQTRPLAWAVDGCPVNPRCRKIRIVG